MKIDPGAPIEIGLSGVNKRLHKLNDIYPIRFNNGVDFGAGKGAYSIELKDYISKIFAFDINSDYIKSLGEKNRSSTRIYPFISSGMQTSIKSRSVESVFVIEVLEHIENLDKTMIEIYRIAKENALIYVTVPNKYFVLETHLVNILGKKIKGKYFPFLSCFDFIHNKIGTARRFSPKRIKDLFQEHGFSFIGIDYMMPPFDNTKFARKYLIKFSEKFEKSVLKFFSPTITAVFKKN